MSRTSFATVCKMLCGGLLLPLIVTGCGGSSHSSDMASSPAPSVPAVISRAGSYPVDYTITVLPSGSATSTYSRGTTSEAAQTGTVPAALTAQFFKDLTAAMPVQSLPLFTGTTTLIAPPPVETVQYQGQSGHIDDPNDAREAALASDAAAIAQALGIPQN